MVLQNNTIMKAMLSRTVSYFPPGSFSFVMATGIVSIAVFQQQMPMVPQMLFVVNKLSYAVLALLIIFRTLFYPRDVLADMISPSRAPSLFTITAATCILGSQILLFSGPLSVGIAFWAAGLFFWAVLSYTFFTSTIVNIAKPASEERLSGEWLIYVVGTQAVAIVSILLSAHLDQSHERLLFAALCFYLIGSALYFVLIVLILRRMMFLDLSPDRLTSPYWINMGAAAISTLSGAQLILSANSLDFLQTILPAITLMTILLWSVTTWWIPLIVILNIWRYGFKHFPIMYNVQHWSMVFPLGMYTACTFQLGKATGLAPLVVISEYFIYVAIATWVIVFLGMVTSALRKIQWTGHTPQQ